MHCEVVAARGTTRGVERVGKHSSEDSLEGLEEKHLCQKWEKRKAKDQRYTAPGGSGGVARGGGGRTTPLGVVNERLIEV